MVSLAAMIHYVDLGLHTAVCLAVTIPNVDLGLHSEPSGDDPLCRTIGIHSWPVVMIHFVNLGIRDEPRGDDSLRRPQYT